MSFGGYAIPFVQGATSRKELIRRVRMPSLLGVGILVGGLALMIATTLIRSLLPEAAVSVTSGVFLVLVASLVCVDLVAVLRGRMFPLTIRRQAKQALAHRWKRLDHVLLLWGFDAGWSLGTYRVTSGVWVLLVAVLTFGASPLLILLSLTTFSVSLVTTAIVPLAKGVTDQAAVEKRFDWLLWSRRRVQTLYVVVAASTLIVVASIHGAGF